MKNHDKFILFQVDTSPFNETALKTLEEKISTRVCQFLEKSDNLSKTTEPYIRRELKNILTEYCQLGIPEDADTIDRKQFYSRLKTSMKKLFPQTTEDFVSTD